MVIDRIQTDYWYTSKSGPDLSRDMDSRISDGWISREDRKQFLPYAFVNESTPRILKTSDFSYFISGSFYWHYLSNGTG